MKNLKELDKYRVKHPFWPQTAISGAFKAEVVHRPGRHREHRRRGDDGAYQRDTDQPEAVPDVG